MLKDKKRMASMSKIARKCKCGHTVHVPAFCDFVYCNNCWRTVYKDDKTEFKRELMKKMGKGINEQVRKGKNE